jgi:hypothetical protein
MNENDVTEPAGVLTVAQIPTIASLIHAKSKLVIDATLDQMSIFTQPLYLSPQREDWGLEAPVWVAKSSLPRIVGSGAV